MTRLGTLILALVALAMLWVPAASADAPPSAQVTLSEAEARKAAWLTQMKLTYSPQERYLLVADIEAARHSFAPPDKPGVFTRPDPDAYLRNVAEVRTAREEALRSTRSKRLDSLEQATEFGLALLREGKGVFDDRVAAGIGVALVSLEWNRNLAYKRERATAQIDDSVLRMSAEVARRIDSETMDRLLSRAFDQSERPGNQELGRVLGALTTDMPFLPSASQREMFSSSPQLAAFRATHRSIDLTDGVNTTLDSVNAVSEQFFKDLLAANADQLEFIASIDQRVGDLVKYSEDQAQRERDAAAQRDLEDRHAEKIEAARAGISLLSTIAALDGRDGVASDISIVGGGLVAAAEAWRAFAKPPGGGPAASLLSLSGLKFTSTTASIVLSLVPVFARKPGQDGADARVLKAIAGLRDQLIDLRERVDRNTETLDRLVVAFQNFDTRLGVLTDTVDVVSARLTRLEQEVIRIQRDLIDGQQAAWRRPVISNIAFVTDYQDRTGQPLTYDQFLQMFHDGYAHARFAARDELSVGPAPQTRSLRPEDLAAELGRLPIDSQLPFLRHLVSQGWGLPPFGGVDLPNYSDVLLGTRLAVRAMNEAPDRANRPTPDREQELLTLLHRINEGFLSLTSTPNGDGTRASEPAYLHEAIKRYTREGQALDEALATTAAGYLKTQPKIDLWGPPSMPVPPSEIPPGPANMPACPDAPDGHPSAILPLLAGWDTSPTAEGDTTMFPRIYSLAHTLGRGSRGLCYRTRWIDPHYAETIRCVNPRFSCTVVRARLELDLRSTWNGEPVAQRTAARNNLACAIRVSGGVPNPGPAPPVASCAPGAAFSAREPLTDGSRLFPIEHDSNRATLDEMARNAPPATDVSTPESRQRVETAISAELTSRQKALYSYVLDRFATEPLNSVLVRLHGAAMAVRYLVWLGAPVAVERDELVAQLVGDSELSLLDTGQRVRARYEQALGHPPPRDVRLEIADTIGRAGTLKTALDRWLALIATGVTQEHAAMRAGIDEMAAAIRAVRTPVVAADATALTFPERRLGESDTATVTVTNVGRGAPVTLDAPVLSGIGRASFSISTGCPQTLAPGQSCSVTVAFKPISTIGLQSAVLTVKTDAIADIEIPIDAAAIPRHPPVLRGLRLSPLAFRAASGRGPSVAKRGGAVVHYALSAPAVTSFAVERAAPGVRRGSACVRPDRRRRRARPCTRFVPVPGGFTHRGAGGANRFRFTGRVEGRRLPAARYRLVAKPRDDAGQAGRAVRAAFRVVR